MQRGKTQATSFEQSNKEEYRFAKTLGIEDDISVESVKSSYRRLIKTYHPDKVYHLGNEYVKLAEEKMKDVNLAYNYFMKKFNL